jgi:hypothetical protein
MVSHEAFVVGFHAHPVAAVTPSDPLIAAAEMFALLGETAYVHPRRTTRKLATVYAF